MSIDTQIINQINNYSKSVESNSLKILTNFGNNQHNVSINDFTKKSEIIKKKTVSKLDDITVSDKYNTNPISTAQETIFEALTSLSNTKLSIEGIFNTNVTSFANDLIEEVGNKINDFSDKVSEVIDGITDQIQQTINDAIDNITTLVTNTVDNLIETFNTAIENISDIISNSIESLIKKVEDFIDGITQAAESVTTTVSNYYKREKGQSSTSKYIQAKVPSTSGSLKPNSGVLSKTPDSEILTPKLKKDTNSTITYDQNPLAKALGLVGSLLPLTNQKKVEEPKPTGDKAEYGKIQVKENKAGFVEIMDETKGNVRKITQHPTGTYTAMLDNGDIHTKVTNDRQEMTDGNWNIKTTKDKIEIVEGDTKIEIRKNYTENIKNNKDINIDGNSNSVVKGDVSQDYKSTYTSKITGNYSESVGANRTEKTDGNFAQTISGNYTETVNANLTIHVSGNSNIISGGNATISAGGIVRISGAKVMIG